MNRKEKFVMFVYLAAIARDLTQATRESQQVAHGATKIPDQQIPVNTFNAAQVYISYLEGRTRPYKWMFATTPGAQAELEARLRPRPGGPGEGGREMKKAA